MVNGYYDYGVGLGEVAVCTPNRARKGKCSLPDTTPPNMTIGLPSPPVTVGDPDAAWLTLGWPSKTMYHQAGRPNMTYAQYQAAQAAGTGTGTGTATGTDGGGITGTGSVPTSAANSGGGLAGLLSGIPTTYLYIGGALVIFMMVKKR